MGQSIHMCCEQTQNRHFSSGVHHRFIGLHFTCRVMYSPCLTSCPTPNPWASPHQLRMHHQMFHGVPIKSTTSRRLRDRATDPIALFPCKKNSEPLKR